MSNSAFDVFLCHRSGDKPAVEEIGRRLRERGVKPWLDVWELRPGLPWQRTLEEQIRTIGAAAVFVGPEGRGPWQDLEIQAFLRQFVQRGCPVIPVILARCEEVPVLPVFLEGMTWVDFRDEGRDPLAQLVWGITGDKPDVGLGGTERTAAKSIRLSASSRKRDELLRRIVRVEARFDKTAHLPAGTKCGTGFRLGPGQVLTAQHVVERGHRDNAIERAVEVRVLLDEDGSGEQVVEETATVAWRGEDRLDPTDPTALDAALLEDGLPHGDLKPFRDWVRVPLGSSGRWETVGYAAASRDIDPLGIEYLWGTCHPAREAATYLKLTFERCAPLPDEEGKGANWGGVSGGPVFVKEGCYRGHLYGIVRQSPRRFQDALYAVGTPALLRDAGLRQLLGFKEPPPPHASLVEKLRLDLERDRVLARRLAGLDDAWRQRFEEGGNDDLVDALCTEGRLGPMVEHLRRLYRRDKKSAAGERIREVAMALVPILAGKELPGGDGLTVEWSRRIIRLDTASPNFAEALLASAYGTPCLYDNPTGQDVPQARLRVPTAVLEAGIHARSQVAEELEELLMVLMEEDLGKSPFLLPAYRALLSRVSGGPRQDLLEDLLRRRLARIEQDFGRRAHLVADEELHKKMGDHLEVFLDRLAKVLPKLDLVVLETGRDKAARAQKIAQAIEEEDQLWPLWEILDLLPE